MGPEKSAAVLVVADSPDLTESVGCADLTARAAAGGTGLPHFELTTVPAARWDVMTQAWSNHPAPRLDCPPSVGTWFEACFAAPDLPDAAIAMVISASEALTARVLRHRNSGALVQLPRAQAHDPETEAWLSENFEIAPPSPEQLASHLVSIEHELAARNTALVVFNVSTHVPGERVAWYRRGEPEPQTVMANRIDLALETLPRDSTIAVVDVDRIVAELGTADAVLAPGRYSPQASALLATDASRALAEHPLIHARFSPAAMRLELPRYDRRTAEGLLTEWHVSPLTAFRAGDPLFDVRFENLRARAGASRARESHRALEMSVVARQDGFLQRIIVAAGQSTEAGATVAIVTRDRAAPLGEESSLGRLLVAVDVRSR